MKFLESHELVNKFVRKYVNSARDKENVVSKVVGALITGTILLGNSSPNKIQQSMVTAPSKSTFYRNIHRLASEMPDLYKQVLTRIQADKRLMMRSDGFLSLDEHVIPHSSDKMEGVDWFYSTTEDRPILGLSAITMHYYRNDVEYPVTFEFYRRLKELQEQGGEEKFKEKNFIARELLTEVCQLPGAPKVILMDSFFMTKENVTLLKKLGRDYVSRPKKNWKCNIDHKKHSMEEVFESIPVSEFQTIEIVNPKTGKTRKERVATKDVFFPKIGMHRVVFIDCTPKDEREEGTDDAEMIETTTGRKFRLFVTNVLTWDAATILTHYAVRWTIETSYRDMSQDLNLHGCKWRQLDGQYCFIALTFACYLFLMWAKIHGLLMGYNDELQTVGQMKVAFEHYCQDRFVHWLAEVKQECKTCPLANWIHEHVYAKSGQARCIS